MFRRINRVRGEVSRHGSVRARDAWGLPVFGACRCVAVLHALWDSMA
jgi:hypothetical protein